MDKGKIIKLYRKKIGLTQEELCKEICSVTHLSKIELNQTQSAAETLLLLSNRLQINIDEEIIRFESTKIKLNQWHDAIIMENDYETESLKNELESNELVDIFQLHTYFKLISARYRLSIGDQKEALQIIRNIKKSKSKLPSYEGNLLNHILGIYHIYNEEFKAALGILQSINEKEYNSPEFYFDLSFAYDRNDSYHMSYLYAKKALKIYIETNSFLKIIDTKILILILQGRDKHHNIRERLTEYETLLKSCELCNSQSKQAKIYHNMAHEYLQINDYNSARKLYKKSMDMKEKKSEKYLLSLEGYIQSCFKGNIISPDELLKLAQDGINIAEEINDLLDIHLFKLSLFSIKDSHTEYYNYLQNYALPFFKMKGHITLVKEYKKDLFNFFLKTGQLNKAVDIANSVINDCDT